MSDFRPELFGGNEDAARFVENICDVAHTWDDLIDQDKPVSPDAINRCFHSVLVRIPNNPFYRQYFDALSPLIFSGVLGYMTANRMEKSGDLHQIEIAHGLRYAVAHVAVFAIAVTNPPEKVHEMLPEVWMWLMPERFADYLKEHAHAD